MEEVIKRMMESLDITREEALELIEYDEAIDHGAKKLGELPPDKKKNAKKAKNVGRGPTVYRFERKNQRQEDPDKRFLINLLKSALENKVEDLEVTHIEREIVIHYNNRKFKVILSAPRS